MLPGPVQVGDRLADRYLLLDPVASEGPTSLWRARDEVLARDVAVRVLPTPDKTTREQAEPFLEAAARAGKATHPGLVRVYDAAFEARPGHGAHVAYLIREWVEGEPLDEHLERVGELAAPDAADVLRQVADALSTAHAQGLAHGRLHPRNVLVAANGRVRLTDAVVAATVHGDPVPQPLDALATWRDTRDAAAVLYALLTTRWPAGSTPQPPGSLPVSPLDRGHALPPHRVRAAVPLRLDHVVERALDPGQVPSLPPLRTPAALADAADACVAEERRERVQATARKDPGWVRRHALWLAAAAVVLTFAAGGWFAGLSVGALPRRQGAVDALVASPGPPSSGSAASTPFDLTTASVRDFDPEGDGQENPDQVHNAVDLDPRTAWATDLYRTAAFGGLKKGVGLLVDVGSVRAVHEVQVGFTAPGAHVELWVGNTAPARLSDLSRAAAANDGKQVAVLTPPPGTSARYLLVWITLLPRDGSGYRVGIAELRVT